MCLALSCVPCVFRVLLFRLTEMGSLRPSGKLMTLHLFCNRWPRSSRYFEVGDGRVSPCEAISYGGILKYEQLRISRASKPDAQSWVDNLLMTRMLHFVSEQQVLTSIIHSGRKTCMRYATEPPRDFRFLPGLLVVMELLALCLVVGTRENTTCTLHASKVIFRSCLPPRCLC